MTSGEPARERRRDPWLGAFALALAAFAGSLALLVYVLLDRSGPAASAASVVGEPTTSPSVTPALTYAGSPPAGFVFPGLVAVTPGRLPDLDFDPSPGATTIVDRYFVPVAAISAGVDALTRQQLADLVSGRITNWKDVGGVSGKVTFAVSGPEADQSTVLTFFDGARPAKTYASIDDLRAAMTWDSGMLALVPMDEVRVAQVAIAVDGVDLVRGRGDPATWPYAERTAVSAQTPAGRDALPALQQALAAKLPSVTHVVATGDIIQARCSLAKIEASGDWAAALRGPMADYLTSADLTLGSLDGSITDFAKPYLCEPMDYPTLTAPAETIQALTLAHFSEVTIATNHSSDCGRSSPCGSRALLRTIDLLNQAGIKTVGGGHNLDEALTPAIFDVNGVKFGVLGFDDIAAEDFEATATDPGTAPLDDSYADEKAALPREPAFYKPAKMLDLTRFQDTIKKLKQLVDVVIVQVHTGFEDTHEASPRSIKALRAAAAAGADLVVGNQGHNVQPVEVIGNTWISYALGNFIFDQHATADQTEGYVLEATFWGKQLANVRMIPYHIADQYRPTFVDGATRAKILTDLVNGTATLPPR